MSKTLLDTSAARHEALASNIANVETPGYKRVDISPDFSRELQRRFASGEKLGAFKTPAIAKDVAARSERADGNNVQLDDELLKMSANGVQFEALTEFVSGSLARLKTAITGRDAR